VVIQELSLKIFKRENSMSTNINELMQMPSEQRYAYLLKEVVSSKEVWILTDEHGCVMLNSDDEDCVPVWPSQACAQYWASGDWSHCNPKAISLQDWLERWTSGLEGDDVAVAVFPNPNEEGLVVFPDVFDDDLRKQISKT